MACLQVYGGVYENRGPLKYTPQMVGFSLIIQDPNKVPLLSKTPHMTALIIPNNH